MIKITTTIESSTKRK